MLTRLAFVNTCHVVVFAVSVSGVLMVRDAVVMFRVIVIGIGVDVQCRHPRR